MSKGQPSGSRAKKHRFNKAWMNEHVSDHWVQEAQRLGFRSRAAFKLLELAEKDRLLRPGMTVVDLGAAPGSWCQVLRQRLGPAARIVAIDLLPMDPIAGVAFRQGPRGRPGDGGGGGGTSRRAPGRLFFGRPGPKHGRYRTRQ